MIENDSSTIQNCTVPVPQAPCDRCGHCPTCGRGPVSIPAKPYVYPYNPYYPWTQPYTITYTSTNTC
jgi:hypothetical protein